MIFNMYRGQGMSGVLRYIQGEGREENGRSKTLAPGEEGRAKLLGGVNFRFDIKTDEQAEIARRLMEWNAHPDRMVGSGRRCVNDALHLTVSWDKSETPDPEHQLETCKRFMKALGVEDAQALFYAHKDKDYDHAHMAVSGVNPKTGRTYDQYQWLYKGMHQAIEYERETGHIPESRKWCHELADLTKDDVQQHQLLAKLMQPEATIKKTKLEMALAFGGHFGDDMKKERESFVKEHDMIRLKKYEAGRTHAYTTKEMWAEEARVLAMARECKERSGFAVDDKIVDKYAKRYTLTQEQRDALRWMTRDDGMAIVTGEAGTGKSHTNMAARLALQHSGRKVRGVGMTNQVAQDMQRDGFESATIASELMKLNKDQKHWDKDTVVFVEEAAQTSTKPEQRFSPDLARLFHYANKHKSKLVLVGHDRQLGSIEPGGLFSSMERRFGSARLTEVMRNKDKEEQKAWNKMAKYKFADPVETFKKKDSIRWHDNEEQTIKALADQYVKDLLEHPDDSRLILAATNKEVKALNEAVQKRLKENGKLGKEALLDTSKGPTNFAVGDRIVMNETPYHMKEAKKKGLVNGAFGYLRGLDKLESGRTQMTIELDRKKDEQRRMFKFPVGMDQENGEVSGVGHGYASTVYKSQGKSIDRTYVKHNPNAQAPTNYVELSRHKKKTLLYVNHEETSDYNYLAAQLKHGDKKRAAHDYMVDEADRQKLQTPQQAERRQQGEKEMPADFPEVIPPTQHGKAENGNLRDKTEATKPLSFRTVLKDLVGGITAPKREKDRELER